MAQNTWNTVVQMLGPFSHLISSKEILPFNKSHIFTLSLKLITFTFTLLSRHLLLFRRHNLTKLRAEKLSADHTV
jgi:hypothetical protein